ncbi:hypothetical protein RhiirA1_454063 [Rhizophagus irregularis]|uniref:RNase H type-1 domain-containing protein n=1 Tax=Rhizophagus irregularis TaxID=588596 RepID=A0A2N0S623_9GLOM|nr:hypothetical protein RhiirA1_454063 [Rhizophagus irregularis]
MKTTNGNNYLELRMNHVDQSKNITWDAFHQCELYGKTVEKRNDIYGYKTHYIPEDINNRPNLTPKRRLPALKPCPGCPKHTYFDGDRRPRCVLVTQTQHLILFSIISLLCNLAISFSSCSTLTFYTDGSLSKKASSSNITRMGFTWAEVKAHSGDPFNDLCDELAKSSQLLDPIKINVTKLPGSLMTPIWASIGPIDRDVRKFAHAISDCYTFDDFLSNLP